MKKLLIAATLFGLSSVPALAADLAARPYTKAPPMVVQAYSWSGFYIGANVGGGWSTATLTDITNNAAFAGMVPGQVFSNGMSGVVGGGQIGYNMQMSNWVVGIEAMYDASGMTHSQFAPTPPPGDDLFTTKVRSVFTLTGKLGYAMNNWLAYAKGGYAGGDVRVTVSDTNAAGGSPVGSGAGSSWRSGYTLGAGLEYGFAPNWSAALEYDYAKLKSDSYNLGDATGSYIVDAKVRDIHMLTARVNYRFGGPVVAKY